jgi:hypothetical protein
MHTRRFCYFLSIIARLSCPFMGAPGARRGVRGVPRGAPPARPSRLVAGITTSMGGFPCWGCGLGVSNRYHLDYVQTPGFSFPVGEEPVPASRGHSPCTPYFGSWGGGGLAPPLFGRLQWSPRFFLAFEGPFWGFYYEIISWRAYSYAFRECFCANINSKWQFSKCGSSIHSNRCDRMERQLGTRTRCKERQAESEPKTRQPISRNSL